MTNITKFTTNSYHFNFNLYKILKTKRWISIYFNGKKYFFFIWKGRICYLSEFSLCLILCSLVFIGILVIRKGIKRYKLKKRVVSLIKNVRGGQQIIDPNEILHYETEIEKEIEKINYHPIAISHFKLKARQKIVKSIVKKCLKPGHLYKITDRGTLQIIDKMMDFKRRDIIRIISYEVFVLALTIGSKPRSIIGYQGLANILDKLAVPVLVENFPLIAAILMAVKLAFQADLNLSFTALVGRFLLMILKSTGVFSSVEFLRSTYYAHLIDCSDYVVELPQTDIKELPHADTLPELDSSSSSSSKISYTRDHPNRHDTFVSTSPNSDLHYQEDVQKFQIKTLDGSLKQTKRLNGETTIEWVKNRESNQCRNPKYIPLEGRTRTLADVKNLDSTVDRESASEIIKTITEEQVTAALIRQSLDGE